MTTMSSTEQTCTRVYNRALCSQRVKTTHLDEAIEREDVRCEPVVLDLLESLPGLVCEARGKVRANNIIECFERRNELLLLHLLVELEDSVVLFSTDMLVDERVIFLGCERSVTVLCTSVRRKARIVSTSRS